MANHSGEVEISALAWRVCEKYKSVLGSVGNEDTHELHIRVAVARFGLEALSAEVLAGVDDQ